MKKSGDILYSLRRYDYLEGNFTQISNDVFKLTNGNEFKIYYYLIIFYPLSQYFINYFIINFVLNKIFLYILNLQYHHSF